MDRLFSRNDNIIRRQYKLPDGEISGVHFGPMDAPVKLVFLHANGFNGLAYRSILEVLGVHVIALDLRGHGHTTLTTIPNSFSTFYPYAQDVAKFLQTDIGHSVVLAGHSLGASTSILTAKIAPEIVTRILALDAIILPRRVRATMAFGPTRRMAQRKYPLAKSAARRRADFDSFKAAFLRYHGKGPFKEFPDTALWDYVSGGFLPTDQGVTLACRPSWEQFTYTAQSQDLIAPIHNLPHGSQMILTDFVKQNPKWMIRAMEKNQGLSIVYRPDLSHFYPMINPEISIPALKQILQD